MPEDWGKLRWLPTKIREDERPISPPKKPGLERRESLRTRCEKACALLAPRYMLIRQQSSSSPQPAQRFQQRHKGSSSNTKSALVRINHGKSPGDLVSHYDHDISTLHTAAEIGDTATIKELFGRGVNLDARNENGETAVFIAALYDQRRAVQCLSDLGASVRVADKLGQTPLFIAATENLVDMLRLLVRAGASVHVANRYGCTPLYGAAMNGCLEAIHLLHELGADVNAPNKTGDSRAVLYDAALCCSVLCCVVLCCPVHVWSELKCGAKFV